MKLANCLRILLTVAFVVGILSSTIAGQKGVVLSPVTEGAKVESDASKVTPEKVVPKKEDQKVVPKKEDQKVVPESKKKLDLGKQPQKPTLPVRCNGEIVTILGTSGVDFLNGTPGPDVIHGLGGNDTINGLGGNDVICGGDGDDTLYGRSGNDTLDGGRGNDKLYGGPGYDECINGPSGAGFLVAPKNCEKKGTSSTVGISSKTQPKPGDTSGGFVPAQKEQLETQKQYEAKKKAIAVQQDSTEQESNDTSMGKYMSKPSNTMKFQTHLSVKLPDDKWGPVYNDSDWLVLKFRWRIPTGDNPVFGKWQISMSSNFNTIIVDGDAGRVFESGQYQWFFIDFKNVAEQYAIPNRVYVRVVPDPESKLYAPSSPVKVSIIDAGNTVFTVYPWIETTLGNPGINTISPEGKLYITGTDFGTEKGQIFIYGIGFPDGKLELDPVVWESGSRVNGRVPLFAGIKDQKIEVEVVTKEGLVSNRHEHMFLGTRETRKLLGVDSAVEITCSLNADSNICGPGAGSTFGGYHRNWDLDLADDVGTDTVRIELKNGWKIVDVDFSYKTYTSDEKLEGPIPNWKIGMTVWQPTFHWRVSPADSVSYDGIVTIEGPKGVPYH